MFASILSGSQAPILRRDRRSLTLGRCGMLSPQLRSRVGISKYGVTVADASTDLHEALKPLAEFGPLFQRLKRLHGGPAEVLAEIDGTIDCDGFVIKSRSLRVNAHLRLGPKTTFSIRSSSIRVSTTTCTQISFKTSTGGPSFCLRNSRSSWFTEPQFQEAGFSQGLY